MKPIYQNQYFLWHKPNLLYIEEGGSTRLQQQVLNTYHR